MSVYDTYKRVRTTFSDIGFVAKPTNRVVKPKKGKGSYSRKGRRKLLVVE